MFRVVTDTWANARRAATSVTVRSGEAEPIFPPFLKTHPVPDAPLRVVVSVQGGRVAGWQGGRVQGAGCRVQGAGCVCS